MAQPASQQHFEAGTESPDSPPPASCPLCSTSLRVATSSHIIHSHSEHTRAHTEQVDWTQKRLGAAVFGLSYVTSRESQPHNAVSRLGKNVGRARPCFASHDTFSSARNRLCDATTQCKIRGIWMSRRRRVLHVQQRERQPRLVVRGLRPERIADWLCFLLLWVCVDRSSTSRLDARLLCRTNNREIEATDC